MRGPAPRRQFLRALAALAAAAASGARPATGGSRVALVIGNNRYALQPLANAANDARAVAQLLASAGFEVQSRIDATGAELAGSVREFGERLQAPGVGLGAFYYAGHGVQVDWRNYLLPVDAKIASRGDLQREAFDLGGVLAALPRTGGKSFLIILDACRDNPFGTSFVPDHKGLAPFDAPVGTLIAFSTSPGSVASDGSGANGLYTENLVRELAIHGAPLEDAFKRVRVNVSLASRGAQVPWESTSLTGDVFVFPPDGALTEEEAEKRFEAEVAYWNRVKGSRDPADWAAMLRAFPNGKLSEIAQARLNALLAVALASAPSRQLRLKPRYVELGEGLEVPAYFQRDPNPNSAGSYPIDRDFRVGDQARYRAYDEDAAQARRAARRVTRVDPEAQVVELNDGRIVTDLSGNLLKHDENEYRVPVQLVPAELQVGRRWSASYRSLHGGHEFDEDMGFAIAGRERVTVPAGTFDAFRIEGRSSGVEHQQRAGKRSRFARRREMVAWEVPGLNFPVKEEHTRHRRDGRVEHEVFELVSLVQGAKS